MITKIYAPRQTGIQNSTGWSCSFSYKGLKWKWSIFITPQIVPADNMLVGVQFPLKITLFLLLLCTYYALLFWNTNTGSASNTKMLLSRRRNTTVYVKISRPDSFFTKKSNMLHLTIKIWHYRYELTAVGIIKYYNNIILFSSITDIMSFILYTALITHETEYYYLSCLSLMILYILYYKYIWIIIVV